VIEVHLVDDHTLVREAVAQMLDAHPEITVVAQAGSLGEAQRLAALGRGPAAPAAAVDAAADAADGSRDASVWVVDVSMPDGNGLTFVRSLREVDDSAGLVVLTMHDDDETLLEALDAGASALVRKTAPAEEIVSAVLRAAENPLAFTATGLAEALRRRSAAPQTVLTPRETEVLQALAEGASVAQVGKRLYMSTSTVKTHIGKIYDKLGVHNRAGAVMAAVRLGLISSGEGRSGR
jgi:DNA-binding NarL/FixJ family response regulator